MPEQSGDGVGSVQPWCLAAVPLPPPVHGAALVSSFVVRELAARAARDGVDVVACDTAPRDASRWLYHLQRVRLNLAAVALLISRSARDRVRPVSVYIGGAGGLGLFYQLVLVATCRVLRVPTYFHHHSYAYIHQRSVLMALIVRSGGRRLRHIFLGQRMQEQFGDLYRPQGRGYRCSNAVAVADDMTSTSLAKSDSGAGIVLGHLSNLSRAKGLYDVMDAFDCVRALDSGARLRIAGGVGDPREEADLMAFCERHGDAVDWMGPVPNSEVAPFMSGVDLLLFPSTYANEAQPLVVLEALRAGTPVAAYDVGELASCIGAGGALCDPTASFPDLVTGLVQVDMEKRDHLRRMGERARRQFDESLRTAEVDLMHLADDVLSKQGC